MTNQEFLPTVYSFIDKRKKKIKSLEKASKSQGMSNDIDYLIRRNDTDLAIWQKIQQMIETDSTIVNIGNLKSSFIPIEMFDLDITELNLDNNELSELPSQIERLKNLRKLSVNGNGLEILPDGIGNLTSLEILNLDGNRLNKLPNSIAQLQNLRLLDLYSNEFENLQSEIFQISSLVKLYAGNNKIRRLPQEIKNLQNLEELLLSETRLTELPRELRELKKLRLLNLRRSNLLQIPPEIVDKIKQPEIILDYYFSHTNKRALFQAKVLVVGLGSVGKTSLIRRITRGDFDISENKTEGIFIDNWQVDNYSKGKEQRPISLNIWDFGGQEINHSMHQFFLTKRSLYLLVLDSRITQEQNQTEYWLKIIQSFGGESPVIVIGNKSDQHKLDIDRTGLQKKYPNIVGILETSAATGAGIEELKAAIAEQVNNLPHVRDLLPETWFTVKTKLEELGRQSNFITHDKYLELCAENEVSDEISQRTLIGFLHDLGVVLHFQDDPRLEALGILNPQWVTNGVYKILNSHTLFQNKGVLTTSMLDEILNLPEYPRGKRLFIVDMMKKFELCYDIQADKTFLVPDLLPKDEPAELKFNGVPAFEYAYPVLPSSVITRFIVRMNQKIDDSLVWRTGVVLKIGENLALVKADIEDRKITIAIDGVEHTRRDALSAIRYQLDEIHGSIKGLNPEKYVPVPGVINAKPLKYEYLLKLERAGKDTLDVEDGDGLKEVKIAQMLNGVESEYQRKQHGNVTNISIGGNANGSTIIIGNENEVKKYSN